MMAQWLRGLAQDPVLVLITHMVVHNLLHSRTRGSDITFCLPHAAGPYETHIHTCSQNKSLKIFTGFKGCVYKQTHQQLFKLTFNQ